MEKKRVSGCSVGIAILCLFILYIICDNLKYSNFKQIGYYKQDHNRDFSYFTSETDTLKILNHAKKQMWTEGYRTFVFYFSDPDNTPDITFTGWQFDPEYEPYCIAAYWKYTTGKEKFSTHPFKP